MPLRRRRHRNLRFAVLCLAVAAAACSDHSAPLPGKACQVMSDCDNPLSCSFGKCHEACRADGDCPNGGLCVVAETVNDGAVVSVAGLHVCIQDTCFMNSQCPDPLICSRDFKCRQACATDKDCAREDDRCIVGGKNGELVCARPMDVEDGGVLKGDGPFTPAVDGGTDAPSADDGGAAGDGGVETAPDGGSPGDGGPPPTPDGGDAGDTPADVASDGGAPDAPIDVASDGGAPEVPADVPSDVLSDVAAPVDAGTDGVTDAGVDAALGPCGIPDPFEPNEDSTAATPYTLGTSVAGCVSNLPDHDVYAIVVPAGDKAGGYFTASITGVGNGPISALVTDSFDSGPVQRYDNIVNNLSLFLYWAGAAKTTYYLDVARYGGGTAGPSAFKYTVRVDYVKIDDAYEPNDSVDNPAPITLGTPVTAYYYTGFAQQHIAATEFLDWYKVEVPGTGPLTLMVTSVPLKTALRYTVYTTGNLSLGTKSSANGGAEFGGTVNIPGPGTYRILIDANPHNDAMSGNSTMIPDSFMRPYTLTVSQ